MPDGAVPHDEALPQGAGPGFGLLGPKTRHLLALEFGPQAQFDDPRLPVIGPMP